MLTIVFDAAPLITACKTDDYLAFVAATRLGLRTWMLPDVVVELAARKSIAFGIAEAILMTIRPRYRRGVIAHSMARLQEVQEHAKSRSTGEGGHSPGRGTS